MLTPRVVVRVLVAVVLLGGISGATLLACLPAYTFSDGGLVDGSGDSGTDSPSKSDRSTPRDGHSGDVDAGDATGDVGDVKPGDAKPSCVGAGDAGAFDSAISPYLVVATGAKTFATGFGEQLHAIFAENDCSYWVFYVDQSAGEIQTQTSTDQMTWTPGPAISLGGEYTLADGNNFSVAYGNIAGSDVVHIVANATSVEAGMATLHIRTKIGGGTLKVTELAAIPGTGAGSSCTKDGPATVIAADGTVYDVTAWTSHDSGTSCDTNIYRSTKKETGGPTWTGGFSDVADFVTVPSAAYSHALVGLKDAGGILALYPDEDTYGATDFDSFGWGLSPFGLMPVREDAGAELFHMSSFQSSYDDWASCRLTDSDVRVVRHVYVAGSGTGPSAFEESRYDGSTWGSAPAPPGVLSLSNTGVVLLSDRDPSHGILVVTIDTANALNVAKWNGVSWNWIMSSGAGSMRWSLSGSGCGSLHPRINWIEGPGPTFAVMGADLSGSLAP